MELLRMGLPKHAPRSRGSNPNEYHLVTFDPGGTIGWAHFVVDLHAFSRPEAKVLRWLISWDCGEFTGPEAEQLEEAVSLIHRAHFPSRDFNAKCDVVGEDFELTQLIGGKNLLSPVRINAVLDWECRRQGLQYNLQRRTLRTNVTPARLNLFGFKGRWSKSGPGKDAFAAMQHGVVWLRRIKAQSRSRPWKLSDGSVRNAVWDCSCETTIRGSFKLSTHDLVHP